MQSFEYAAPDSLEAALGLLSKSWGETEILAGGTDLVTCLKQNITKPKRVVSLKNIKHLRGITAGADAVHIGATTTLRELIADTTVQEHFPSLVSAARSIGGAQILSVGTVGGDLCQRPRCWYFRNGHGLFAEKDGVSLAVAGDNRYHAIFGTEKGPHFVSASSLGPALVALGAIIRARSSAGEREILAAGFFQKPANAGERETALKPDEILTSVAVPLKGLRNAVYEVRHRHGLDWPYVAAAVAYKADGDSAAQGAIVLGHVAAAPWSSAAASAQLNGQIDAARAQACGEAAVADAKPLSGNAYKLQLAKTAVKRAVLAAAGIAQA